MGDKLQTTLVAVFFCLFGSSCSSNNEQQFILCTSSDATEEAIFYIKPVTGFAAIDRPRPSEQEIMYGLIALSIPYDFSPTIGGLESGLDYARQSETHYWGDRAYWSARRRYVNWSLDRQQGMLSVTQPSSKFEAAARAGGIERMENLEFPCKALDREQAQVFIDDMNRKNSEYKAELRSKNKF